MMCLSVQDDGVGMDRNKLLCMLSFGFSSKEYKVGNVGRFGIGFKSGSMRLAKDALILTKRDGYAHAALLSQSFLDEIEADDILIPMFSWKMEQGAEGKPSYVADVPLNRTKWQENMRAIEVHTFVRNEIELLQEISKIQGPHGTRIVLFNLRADELDFTAFKNDIRIAGMTAEDVEDVAERPGNNGSRRAATGGPVFQQQREGQLATTDVPEDYSLRSYMEILYLRPRCAFTLRGTRIKFRDPIAHLKQEYYVFPEYRPRGARGGITLHMGYAEEQSKLCGFHIYNKNRLIKMYQRFGAQLQANSMMKDMLGVVEADALEPTHNKQALKEADISYMKFKRHLTQSMNDYYFRIQQIRHAGKAGKSASAPKWMRKRKYTKPDQRERRSREDAQESESDASDDRSMQERPSQRATRGLRKNATGRSAPLTRMKSIHHTLMTHKSSHVFLNPVDPVYWEIPDYFDVIKNPMDLGTIKARLDRDYYVNEDPDAYAADVRLVFANAMTYNKEGDAVYTMARTMSKLFENEWARRMDMTSLTSSDEEEDELPHRNVRGESRRSKRQAPAPELSIHSVEQNDSVAPKPSAALVTVESIPHPLKCVLDESFFKVVEESIQKLEKELREERAKNAASERTAGKPTPSSAAQDTHHSRMFNNLVAENISLKEQITKLEAELLLSHKTQKNFETALGTRWSEYYGPMEELKRQKVKFAIARDELAKANALIEKLRNALPRRICADVSTVL